MKTYCLELKFEFDHFTVSLRGGRTGESHVKWLIPKSLNLVTFAGPRVDDCTMAPIGCSWLPTRNAQGHLFPSAPIVDLTADKGKVITPHNCSKYEEKN